MTTATYSGILVKLCPVRRVEDAQMLAKWNNDSEFVRNWDVRPAYLPPAKQMEEWVAEEGNEACNFAIYTLADDKMIGLVGLESFDWPSGSAWVGIGIGEREYQGKGYGTDAMKTILRFAFDELNLHRVVLTVFEFNTRAIRSYEKCGFKHEGMQREFIYKEDKRWGLVNMGILRSEWEGSQS
jgi:RimJ/RimL family protein N-acetyltransferase